MARHGSQARAAEAFRFAEAAYGADGSADRDMRHPSQVAALLGDAGFGDDVIAAAILHDLVEDTDVGVDEISERFGPEVAELVATMTEDASILGYEERKAEHRERVVQGGERAATIYAADKLAKLRAASNGEVELSPRQLTHYRATLDELRAAWPDLPFLDELERELAR